MRKPRACDSCRRACWPALGVGFPGLQSDAPAALRHVYLWHCGDAACDADCRARFAVKLRDLGRHDLAAKLLGEDFRAAAPAPAPPAELSPGAARARRSPKNPPPPDAGQAALF